MELMFIYNILNYTFVPNPHVFHKICSMHKVEDYFRTWFVYVDTGLFKVLTMFAVYRLTISVPIHFRCER